MSFWMAALSPDCAASASGLRRFCAVGDDETQTHRRAAIPADHRALMREILRRFGCKRKRPTLRPVFRRFYLETVCYSSLASGPVLSPCFSLSIPYSFSTLMSRLPVGTVL